MKQEIACLERVFAKIRSGGSIARSSREKCPADVIGKSLSTPYVGYG